MILLSSAALTRDCAVFVDAETGDGGRNILLKMIVEVIGFSENVIQVVVVDVHVVAELVPVEARCLSGG